MTEKRIKRLSRANLAKLPDRTRTDARAGPELGRDFWKRAKLVTPRARKSVHLRIDPEVFDWFKAQGKGHLTRMNTVLRSYYEAQRRGRR